MQRYFLMPLKKFPYPSKIFSRGIWRDIMHLVLNAIFLVMGLKWGDWKNWRKYHATILFLWFGDLLYNVICYQYIMWQYKESIFAETFLTNHVIITLLIMFVSYPATVLIYLGRFPQKKLKAVLWILFWVAIFSIIEFINLQFLDLITHHNGWSMTWSVIFNVMMFPMLWLHYKKPGTALLLSIPIVVFLLWYFRVPVL